MVVTRAWASGGGGRVGPDGAGLSRRASSLGALPHQYFHASWIGATSEWIDVSTSIQTA